MEQQVKKIMEKIISKQGLMGQVAKKYINNEEKARNFIRECREQTHNESTKKYWGDKLVREIEEFCSEKNS
jgi:hypothetical protein